MRLRGFKVRKFHAKTDEVVTYTQTECRGVRVKPAKKARVVFISAVPEDEDALRTIQEYKHILREVARLPTVETEFVGECSRQDFCDALKREPTVLHISGHGESNTLSLVHENRTADPVDLEWLYTAFKLGVRIPVVLFCACSTDHIAAAVAGKTSVKAAIGFKGGVQDDHARLFTATFYRELANHKRVGDALERARLALPSAVGRQFEGYGDLSVVPFPTPSQILEQFLRRHFTWGELHDVLTKEDFLAAEKILRFDRKENSHFFEHIVLLLEEEEILPAQAHQVISALNRERPKLCSELSKVARGYGLLELAQRLKEEEPVYAGAANTPSLVGQLLSKLNARHVEVSKEGRSQITKEIAKLATQIRGVVGFPEVGREIAGAKLVRFLGSGSFGSVWESRCTETGKTRATKVFHVDKLENGVMLCRFVRSIEHLQELAKRDSTISLSVYHVSPDLLAFTTDKAWSTLGDIPLENVTMEQRMLWFQRLCDKVVRAHEAGVIHRDIKPSNIMFLTETDQSPRLIDWDLAEANKHKSIQRHSTANALGSFSYAAPEQFENSRNASPQSDIYSLGRILHFLIAGEHPPVTFFARRHELPNIDAPDVYREIIFQATDPDAAKRFLTARQLLRVVENAQSGFGKVRVIARRSRRWLRENSQEATIFVALLAVASIFALQQYTQKLEIVEHQREAWGRQTDVHSLFRAQQPQVGKLIHTTMEVCNEADPSKRKNAYADLQDQVLQYSRDSKNLYESVQALERLWQDAPWLRREGNAQVAEDLGELSIPDLLPLPCGDSENLQEKSDMISQAECNARLASATESMCDEPKQEPSVDKTPVKSPPKQKPPKAVEEPPPEVQVSLRDYLQGHLSQRCGNKIFGKKPVKWLVKVTAAESGYKINGKNRMDGAPKFINRKEGYHASLRECAEKAIGGLSVRAADLGDSVNNLEFGSEV